ncbi:hypothetical protein QSH57_005986 [Fusarium oxysporum f. sp. vasinfectum]|nr:hypothetical protein QSH57_005986 [Fusarium oxysporum f. sp. vasinfectum]
MVTDFFLQAHQVVLLSARHCRITLSQTLGTIVKTSRRTCWFSLLLLDKPTFFTVLLRDSLYNSPVKSTSALCTPVILFFSSSYINSSPPVIIKDSIHIFKCW